MENEKRILIIQVSGECEHLWYKDAEQGFPYGANKPLNNFYCAEGVKDWTKGDRSQKTKLVKPSIDCKNCKQAKYRGITRQEAIDRLYHGFYKAKDNGALSVKEMLNGALSALLGEE